ncbi:MAG: LptF/LptG family permease [Deltaproteobacteria bacterium]|nr:LptF/LptG family permease [Deltaproteobacteria bacterium]
MHILSKYIARTFFSYWFFTMVALVTFVIIANVLGNLDNIFTGWNRFLVFLSDLLRSLPGILDILFPMTVLLATVFTFTSFSRTSELVAMRSAGLGPIGQIIPILAVTTIISAMDYANQNYLFPVLNPIRDAQPIRGRTQWLAKDNKFYYFGEILPNSATILSARVIDWRDSPFALTRIDNYEHVIHPEGGNWVLRGITRRELRENLWSLQHETEFVLPPDAFPDVFPFEEPDAHYMPFFDLSRKIRQLQSTGLPVEVYKVEWYQKLAALFAPFILVWFGAPLSQAHHRKGKASGDLMISILGGLVFMITTEIMFTLGKGGFLSPLLATWSVNTAFLALGALLMLRPR